MAATLEEDMRAATRDFVVEGWSGRWTAEKVLKQRSPDCIHTVLPSSQQVPKRTNDEWAAYFSNVEGLIWDATVRIETFAPIMP